MAVLFEAILIVVCFVAGCALIGWVMDHITEGDGYGCNDGDEEDD